MNDLCSCVVNTTINMHTIVLTYYVFNGWDRTDKAADLPVILTPPLTHHAGSRFTMLASAPPHVCCLRCLRMLLTAVFKGISDVCPSNHQLADWLKPSAEHQTSAVSHCLAQFHINRSRVPQCFYSSWYGNVTSFQRGTSVLFMSNILLLLTA